MFNGINALIGNDDISLTLMEGGWLSIVDLCKLHSAAVCCTKVSEIFLRYYSEERTCGMVVELTEKENFSMTLSVLALQWLNFKNYKMRKFELNCCDSVITSSNIESLISRSLNCLMQFSSTMLTSNSLNLLLNCTRLVSLELHYQNYVERDERHSTPSILSKVQLYALQKVVFNNVRQDFMTVFLFNSPALCSVEISQSHNYRCNTVISHQFLSSLPTILHRVTSLKLRGILTNAENEFVLRKRLSSVLHGLTSLALTAHDFSDSTLNKVLKQCSSKHMTALDLSDCGLITCYTASAIVKHCPHITTLNLSDSRRINLSGVKRVLAHCKALQHLNIAGLVLVNVFELTRAIAASQTVVPGWSPSLDALLREPLALRTLRVSSKHVSFEEQCQSILDGSNSNIELRCRREVDDLQYFAVKSDLQMRSPAGVRLAVVEQRTLPDSSPVNRSDMVGGSLSVQTFSEEMWEQVD